MSNIGTIEAQVRSQVGTGGARAVRREGLLPGVIYGGGKDPVMISIDPRAIAKDARSSAFFAKLYEINVDGKKERVLPRDLQLHVVKDYPTHIDFLRVTKGDRLHVSVPVIFTNEDKAPGIKQGGVLNVVIHEVELICDADSIPEKIEFDLTGKDLHDSVHMSNLALPKGAVPAHADRDDTIATIIAPSAVRSAAEEAAEQEAALAAMQASTAEPAAEEK